MINDKPLTKLASKFPELYNWIKSISRYGKAEDFVHPDYKQWKKGKITVSLRIYTKDWQYKISAVKPRLTNEEKYRMKNGDKFDKNFQYKGYLGCTVLARKPRAGEDWQRGNDLPDGKYCEETWQNIMKAIIAFELVKVAKPKGNK